MVNFLKAFPVPHGPKKSVIGHLVNLMRILGCKKFGKYDAVSIPNAVIEGSIDLICDMTERFGFKMSMAKINVPEEGTSPAQEPEDE